MRIFILSGLFFSMSFVIASEVDSFNIKVDEIKESVDILNAEVRRIIDLSVNQSNGEQKKCDKDLLYRVLKEKLGREVISNVEEFAVKSDSVPKVARSKDASIYSDLTLTESVFLTIYPMTMGVTLNMNGHLVGSDKIGHFFSEGHYYLFHYVKKGKKLEDAMAFGQDIYEGFMGIQGTGIYSPGDLMANFHGYRFWATLVGEFKDPLGVISGPSIACENDKWVVKKHFDWREYVDSGWDETKNCSQYSSTIPYEKLGAKVPESLKADCLNQESSGKLREKYAAYFTYLVNTEGFRPYSRPNKKTELELLQESLKWGSEVLDWDSIKNIIVNF